jgi:hypothetical protein
MRLAESATRVELQSSPESIEQINRTMHQRIEYFRTHRDEIPERLRELDAEWDIERALETGSSAISLTGLALGIMGSKKWLVLPLVVQGFFLQHALQGWCPPVPLLRRLGVRTQNEIDYEKYALKALRGDFQSVSSPAPGRADVTEALQAARP